MLNSRQITKALYIYVHVMHAVPKKSSLELLYSKLRLSEVVLQGAYVTMIFTLTLLPAKKKTVIFQQPLSCICIWKLTNRSRFKTSKQLGNKGRHKGNRKDIVAKCCAFWSRWIHFIYILIFRLLLIAWQRQSQMKPSMTFTRSNRPYKDIIKEKLWMLTYGSHRSWHTFFKDFSRTFEVHFQGLFKDFSLFFQTSIREKMINNGLFK